MRLFSFKSKVPNTLSELKAEIRAMLTKDNLMPEIEEGNFFSQLFPKALFLGNAQTTADIKAYLEEIRETVSDYAFCSAYCDVPSDAQITRTFKKYFDKIERYDQAHELDEIEMKDIVCGKSLVSLPGQ